MLWGDDPQQDHAVRQAAQAVCVLTAEQRAERRPVYGSSQNAKCCAGREERPPAISTLFRGGKFLPNFCYGDASASTVARKATDFVFESIRT